MSLTFQKEISFISPTSWNPELNNNMGGHEEKEITKTATFNELSRTNREQHELHFMIMGAFDSIGGKKVKYDPKVVLEMTDQFIESALIVNESFTAADKTQFLNDSIAKLNFGLWLLNEKFAPFFSQLGKK